MTRNEIIEYCLAMSGAEEDYPFSDGNTVMRHAENRKWFALIFERDGKLKINLKCEQTETYFLRTVYKAVTPAWHMNKTHWNTVEIGGDLPDDELYDMIRRSFKLTEAKNPHIPAIKL